MAAAAIDVVSKDSTTPLSTLSTEFMDLTKKIKEELKPVDVIPMTLESVKSLQQILMKSLSEQAVILLPETTALFKNVRSIMTYIQQISAHQENGKAMKPLILLLPKEGASLSFDACVILPENYKAPHGQPTGNAQGEVVFYMDSSLSAKPFIMPQYFQMFYHILTKGCSYKDTKTTPASNVTIKPIFPRAMFFNGSCQQQIVPADSGLWAIYNAFMVILTGHVHFAKNLAPDKARTQRLRAIIQKLISPILPASNLVPITAGPGPSDSALVTEAAAVTASAAAADMAPAAVAHVAEAAATTSIIPAVTASAAAAATVTAAAVIAAPPPPPTPALMPPPNIPHDSALGEMNPVTARCNPGTQKSYDEPIDTRLPAENNGGPKTKQEPNQNSQNHEQFVATFLQKLVLLRDSEPNHHKEIMEALIIALKFLRLEVSRATGHGLLSKLEYSEVLKEFLKEFSSQGYQTKKTNPQDKAKHIVILEELLLRDMQAKKIIYQDKMSDLASYLKILDPAPLQQILKDIENPVLLIRQLQHTQKVQYDKLKAWEDKLKQKINELKSSDRWIPAAWRKAKSTALYLYQHSLLNLSSELFQWLNKPIVTRISRTPVFGALKWFTKKSVKITVYSFTCSSYLAKRAVSTADFYLREEQIPRILRTTGAGLGLALSYYLGVYPVIRMLAVGSLAAKLFEYLETSSINDRKAITAPKARYALSGVNAVRGLSVTVAMLEACYTGNYQHFVRALGGITGSIAATQLATKLWTELKPIPGQPPSEDQVFLLLLWSMAGHDIGYGFTSFGLSIMETISHKQLLRTSVLEKLQTRYNLADLQTDMPNLWTSPQLWFNDENPIELEWRSNATETRGLYFHTHCQAKTYYVPALVQSLECTNPAILARRLGAPA